MSNYPIFGGMELDQIVWNYFPTLPSVYDESLSYLEFLGNVLHNMNEERKHVNSMGEAISLFQKYVLEEISKIDEKIAKKTLDVIGQLIADGTIGKLINEVLFKDLNDKLNTKWKVNVTEDLENYEEENTLYLLINSEPVVDNNFDIEIED